MAPLSRGHHTDNAMNSHDQDDARIRRDALRWVVELTDLGCLDAAALPRGFSDWLSESDRHRAAFIEALRTSRRLNAVDAAHRIDVDEILQKAKASVVVPFPIRHADAGHPSQDNRSPKRGWPWAAYACLLGLLAIPYGVEVLQAAPITYSSGVGQREFIPLEDGSTVELNTRTRIEVRYGPHSREVRLLSGEASFDVKHDRERPFRVVSGGTSVKDVGTQFVVWRLDEGTTSVTVLEGRVEVEAAGRKEMLDAEEVATVSTHGSAARIDLKSVSRPEIQRRMSWQTGVLIFQGQTLAEAVRAINRYNVRQLVIADPSIATLRVGGSCRGVDLESFVALLAVLFDVQAVPSREDANVIELKRRAAPR